MPSYTRPLALPSGLSSSGMDFSHVCVWLCICHLVKQGIVIVGPLLKIEVPTHSDPELVQLPEIFQLLDQSSWKVNESNFSQLEHFHLTLQSQVAQNEKKSWQCEDIVWGTFLSAVRVLNFEILHWASEEACNDIMSDQDLQGSSIGDQHNT